MLQGMHTVWLREHNRLCDAIMADSQYSDLSDDQKFELARKVHSAAPYLMMACSVLTDFHTGWCTQARMR